MSKIKECIISRWGDDGVIIEADSKQAEVVAFAFLTQDPQLITDLNEGKDIHRELGGMVYGCLPHDITSEQRTQIKPGTFLCIYGGGASKFSKEHNVTEEFAKTFIKAFYTRYPQTKIWQDNLVKEVDASKYPIDELTKLGRQRHEGYLITVTGRKLYFKTYDAPDFLVKRGILTNFKPSEIKNYPVQSLATADIQLMLLGRLWRLSIQHRDKFLLVNTVHDSVIIDCNNKYLHFVCGMIQYEFKSIVKLLNDVFGIDFNVKLDVDIKVGSSWGSCKKYVYEETLECLKKEVLL